MTKKGKTVMFASILLAVALIISAAFFSANHINETGFFQIESLLYVLAVLLMGLLSVIIVFLSKVRKSLNEKKLNPDYYERYETILDSIGNSQLRDQKKTEMIEDILDLLLEAQIAGKPAETVIENPILFSQKVIRSYSSPFRSAVLCLLDGVLFFIFALMGINALLWFEKTDMSYFSMKIDLTMVVFLGIIAFVLIPLTKKMTPKQPWVFLLPIGFGIAYIGLIMILRRFFYGYESVQFLLETTIPAVPNTPVFLLYSLAIPVIIFAKSYIRRMEKNPCSR